MIIQLKPIDAKKIYLVTGAVGFIGMSLSRRLLELGCTMLGLDNLNDYYDVRLKYARLDVLRKYDKFTLYKIDLAEKKLWPPCSGRTALMWSSIWRPRPACATALRIRR